ncbi:MAG: uncharacterized protein QOG64_657 [Acidimicrobiaceae bacterium]|nr:uncharacterized protein [Acidimicrobiaceae bacterium]
MTAPVFERLLALQDLDTTIDQLRHRKETLPELAQLGEVQRRAGELRPRLTDAETTLASAVARQTEVEGELTATESRIDEVNKRLYSGAVTASRELQAMSDDVKSLEARKSDLEERVLEAMEAREPLDAEVDGLRAEARGLAGDAQRLQRAIEAGVASIEEELGREVARRESATEGIPADLLGEYEQLRAKFGGVGLARLVGSSCTGCHLTLPASEVARIHRGPEDTVFYCDQCGRILVS